MSQQSKKVTAPPLPPPMPLESREVSDASQNAPTRAVSIRRISGEDKRPSINIQPNPPPSTTRSAPAPGRERTSTEAARKSSYDETGTRRSSKTPVLPPSPPRPIQIPLPPPPEPLQIPLPAKLVGIESPPIQKVLLPPIKPLSPTQSTAAPPPPPPVAKYSKSKGPPPPTVVKASKTKVPPIPAKSTKVPAVEVTSSKKKVRDKMELNANYSILISGTESDSDASSIDNDALQKLAELSDNETAVFDAVSAGSLVTVKEALDSFQFNFNRKNIVGYTILHIAIRRQDEEMVKLILDQGANNIWPAVLKDVLLHAIKEINVSLVRTMLDELDRRSIKTDESGSSRRLHKDYLEHRKSINEETDFINSEFHEDITPLRLAAICDSYELVQLFHDRGHVMREPVPYVQRTSITTKITDDIGPLRAAYRRLHFYQAVSKPAYIAYKANTCSHEKGDSCDPILVAFSLIKDVRQYADEDVFKKEYLDIADDLQDFACQLIQQCRRTEEVEEILGQSEGYLELSPFPRLSMAIDMELKNFAAHRHCQQVMYRYWAGRDWPEWRVKSMTTLVGHFLLRLVFWPLIALWTCLDRTSTWGKMLSCPASCFLSHLASYLYFVAFILLIVMYNPDGPNHRGVPRTGVEYAVLVWVAGFFLSILKQLATRLSSYMSNPWAGYDIATNLLFVVAFIAWWCSPGNPAIDRKHWNHHDATLVGEIFFAAASVMACVRLLRIFQLSTRIGPLLTAVGQMFFDVLNALIFFFVIICAFALGLYRLYLPYQGWEDVDPVTKENVTQSEAFSSFPKAFEALFWSIFSMGSATDTTIIPRTIVSIRNPNITSSTHMHYIENTGKIVHAVYHVVVSLILLNMLLCMMSRTYEVVNENVDVEWKFARTKIWLAYGLDFVNPTPFNFIPSISICMKNKKNLSETNAKIKYYKLINILVQRYFRDKAEIASQETATVESIEALQEDIAEFHSLLEKTEAEQYERDKQKGIPFSETKKFSKKDDRLPLTSDPSYKMTSQAAQRFRQPLLRDHPTSPTTPNVSSIFGDTSDETEFETVHSYDRRLSQSQLPPLTSNQLGPPFLAVGANGETLSSGPTYPEASRNVHFPSGGTPSPSSGGN